MHEKWHEKCFSYIKSLKKRIIITLILIPILTIFIYSYFFSSEILKDAMTAVSILTSALIAVYSWTDNRERERENTERAIRLRYLEKSYIQIALGVRRVPPRFKYPDWMDNKEVFEGLVEAVSVMQLFGEEELIKELRSILSTSPPDFDKILTILRNNLRKELNLEPTTYRVRSFRLASEDEGMKEYGKDPNQVSQYTSNIQHTLHNGS